MTADMGRPKTTFPDLPPRMTARKLRSGKVLFYYTGNGGKEPLGADYGEALHQYADLETSDGASSSATFNALSQKWEETAIQIGKKGKPRAPKTQEQYVQALKELRKGFGAGRLDQIRPMNVSQYLERRSKKVMANREIAVLSIIWNWARAKGYTDKANPCTGIDKNFERPRERYVHTSEYQPVWDKAVFWLQDAMDLLLLTYQRPSDVLKARAHAPDISDGHLWFKQGKTGKRLGFSIEGELKTVVDRATSRPRNVTGSVYLVADEDGQPITLDHLEKEFAKTRGDTDWQLRDLRAKAVTDTGDIRDASARAGHADERITRRVYDRTRGVKVKPLR